MQLKVVDLPAPFRADQRVDAAALDLHGQAVDRGQAAELDGQALHLEVGVLAHAALPCLVLAATTADAAARRAPWRPANSPLGANIMKPMRITP